MNLLDIITNPRLETEMKGKPTKENIEIIVDQMIAGLYNIGQASHEIYNLRKTGDGNFFIDPKAKAVTVIMGMLLHIQLGTLFYNEGIQAIHNYLNTNNVVMK